MSQPDIPKSRGMAMLASYALALLCVAVALGLTFFLRSSGLVTPLFFLAILLSAWFGGIGPGLITALLSTICVDYFFLSPFSSWKFDPSHLPQLLIFFISAVLVSSWSASRKRAETLLRRARDEQEAKVQERTADLKQLNETLQDEILERRLAEELLRASEEQWKAVFENNPTMYFMVDANGITLSVNAYGAQQLGYAVDELIGHPVMDVFYPPDREAVQRNVARCFNNLNQPMNWEARKMRKDGTILWVRETAKAVLLKNRPIILVACEDITERKRSEEALQKTQAELAHVTRVTTMGELTSSIAHEVNQPLAAIVTNGNACLRWLSNNPPNVEEARQSVTRIVKDGHRASEVVLRVRAFFKKSTPEKEQVNINSLIEDVISIVQSELRRNRVQVRTELTNDLPPVISDPIQLQQVLLNLIINGIEAMSGISGRRELMIKSQPYDSGNVLVAVQDTGPGFDEQNVAQLFDAFFTTKPEGLGMGLSISRTTIEAYGGRLWATSNDGGGATFQFTLPITDGNA